MSHSSIAPEAHEIVVLGALSQVPDLVNEVDDATTTSNFGVLQGAVDLFEAASGAILANAASSELFQGLSSIQPQPTVIGQVVGRAHDISKDFPPVCLKWWANVFQILPTDDSPFNKLAQSGLFVTIAMMDLPQISWLRSTREPTRIEKGITCRFHELHDNIMNMAMETFHQLDEMSRNALEPVLQGIVLTASASTVDYKDLKMVLAEKYEYKSQTDSIVSSIRMICFTIGEAFYDVQEGKNSSSRWVQCEHTSYGQYFMIILEFEIGYKSS
uniref:Uncharacterized protein n=1 Tax=Talaromyces marneffei PM1 TaxID=1077442 RepID=A0A093V2V5_TALMA